MLCSRFAGAVAGTTFLAAEKLKLRISKIASTKLNCKAESIIFEWEDWDACSTGFYYFN